MEEPTEKRAVGFFDGQNLYRHAKEAFGHHYPNYDPVKLFEAVCAVPNVARILEQQASGAPTRWSFGLQSAHPIPRPKDRTGQRQLDVAVIFSQDQDLAELVDDIKELARSQDRWIRLACAYPVGPLATTHRGIDKAEWIAIDQATYDACLDPYDHRPAKYRPSGHPPNSLQSN